MSEKLCLECDDPLIGRIDKKFCSDYCRNSYNNKINKDQTNFIRNTNNRLRKNWRILEKLNPKDKCKVSKSKLDANGFDFQLFTSIYKTKTGNTYYFCYNQGYLELEGGYYALVKRQVDEYT